ncbi:MAG: GIY-YIG nuclease family protein [Pedobacter sp.]|jgi:putative endonuclease|uniref:GIY-YIG nuclease family protein n=1 Tax=Pedobacter sp. TaxID=1411316 RepID=UPI0035656329
MGRGGCVYIMANVFNTILYTGVTSELENRVWQHQNNFYPNSFTAKYKCHKLVYFNPFFSIEEAINEEKRIKGGSRSMKIKLITDLNPTWMDLSISFR